MMLKVIKTMEFFEKSLKLHLTELPSCGGVFLSGKNCQYLE